MKLPCNLREIRGKRSVIDLSRTSGVHRGTISMIELGRLLPTEEQIKPLEDAYGASIAAWYPDYVLAVLDRSEEAA